MKSKSSLAYRLSNQTEREKRAQDHLQIVEEQIKPVALVALVGTAALGYQRRQGLHRLIERRSRGPRRAALTCETRARTNRSSERQPEQLESANPAKGAPPRRTGGKVPSAMLFSPPPPPPPPPPPALRDLNAVNSEESEASFTAMTFEARTTRACSCEERTELARTATEGERERERNGAGGDSGEGGGANGLERVAMAMAEGVGGEGWQRPEDRGIQRCGKKDC